MWSFRDALEELEVRRHFDESMLWSAIGIHLGDIHFAEIQTTIKMCAIWFSTFLHYVKDGLFNPDKLAPHCCSQTTAILLAFIPDRHIQDIESVGIGNVIHRCGTPLGDISSISMMIESVQSILKTEGDKRRPQCRAYMMLIGNYGGHMAFTTEPPYCVAYAVDYQDNDPSKMTPCETLNHPYAMVTDNMMVRRLLSMPNWDPSERKHTKGGRLLIPRGVQFSPKLFLEIVIPRNHAGLLVDSAMQQDAPLLTIGPFRAVHTIFPSFPGDLELFTAEEVAQLKELGVFDPQPAFECLPLFPPLVPLTWGKVVSATLGAPPPEIKVDSLGQSLTMDWDEESVLSDSYSDRHSITADSSIMWGRHLGHSSEQKPRTTERQDKDSYRSSDKDRDRNRDRERDRSKKGDIRHGSERPHECSPQCKDHDGECSSTNKHESSHGHEGTFDDCKAKQRCGTIPSPSVSQERPTDASTMCCKQQAYASIHRSSFFPSLSRGSHRPISMLLGVGGQDAACVAEDHCQVDSKWRARHLVAVPLPSVSGWSKGQKWIISSL